jgi:hypothetical protein
MTGLVMNEGYSVGRADEKKGRYTGPMFPSEELFKAIIDDRERTIHERLRLRRQIGPRQPAIRWRFGSRPLTRHDRGLDL